LRLEKLPPGVGETSSMNNAASPGDRTVISNIPAELMDKLIVSYLFLFVNFFICSFVRGRIDRYKTTVLILMYSIIAVMILNMTYIGRLKPELPYSFLLDADEWKVRYCAAKRVKKEPKKPYTMKEAIDYLGQLGGPKRTPSDGPPG
jgi:hypothetical protein